MYVLYRHNHYELHIAAPTSELKVSVTPACGQLAVKRKYSKIMLTLHDIPILTESKHRCGFDVLRYFNAK